MKNIATYIMEKAAPWDPEASKESPRKRKLRQEAMNAVAKFLGIEPEKFFEKCASKLERGILTVWMAPSVEDDIEITIKTKSVPSLPAGVKDFNLLGDYAHPLALNFDHSGSLGQAFGGYLSQKFNDLEFYTVKYGARAKSIDNVLLTINLNGTHEEAVDLGMDGLFVPMDPNQSNSIRLERMQFDVPGEIKGVDGIDIGPLAYGSEADSIAGNDFLRNLTKIVKLDDADIMNELVRYAVDNTTILSRPRNGDIKGVKIDWDHGIMNTINKVFYCPWTGGAWSQSPKTVLEFHPPKGKKCLADLVTLEYLPNRMKYSIIVLGVDNSLLEKK